MKCTRWSKEEVTILREFYPREGTSLSNTKLVGRTSNSIQHKASKLGIKYIQGIKIDRVYGYLRVKYRASPPKYLSKNNRNTYYFCECLYRGPKCKHFITVCATNILSGKTKSCGCLSRETTISRNKLGLENLEGKRFGRWLVIDRAEDHVQEDGRHQVMWNCKCDCGVENSVRASALKDGTSKSCGCLAEELKTGNNSNFWKGGITPLHYQIRNSTKYSEWRKLVFKRDNYTCQVSGLSNCFLNVHHIKPFSVILEENNITTFEEALKCEELWDINNGITLARKWHSQTSNNELAFHRIHGTCDFTEADFDMWLGGESIGNTLS